MKRGVSDNEKDASNFYEVLDNSLTEFRSRILNGFHHHSGLTGRPPPWTRPQQDSDTVGLQTSPSPSISRGNGSTMTDARCSSMDIPAPRPMSPPVGFRMMSPTAWLRLDEEQILRTPTDGERVVPKRLDEEQAVRTPPDSATKRCGVSSPGIGPQFRVPEQPSEHLDSVNGYSCVALPSRELALQSASRELSMSASHQSRSRELSTSPTRSSHLKSFRTGTTSTIFPSMSQRDSDASTHHRKTHRDKAPLMRWVQLCLTIMRPKMRLALVKTTYNVRDVWQNYLTMLRHNEGQCRLGYMSAKARILMEGELMRKTAVRGSSYRSIAASGADSLFSGFGKKRKNKACNRRRAMLHPHSPTRIILAFLSFVILTYDTIMLPIDAAFDLGDGSFFNFMMWSAMIFWILDIPLTFSSGKYVNGILEMRPSRIARHYLTSWFPFDVFLVILDWTLVFIDVGLNERPMGSFGNAVRSVRIVRLARLLRLGKLQFLLRDALAINNKGVIVFSGMIKMTIAYGIYFHFCACIWFAIGDIEADGWGSRCESTSPTVNCYFTAASWAISQVHGTSDMRSDLRTTVEWVFATLVCFFGLLLFAFFLGKCAEAVAQLTGAEKLELRQRCVTFSKSHKLSAELSQRLLRYVEVLDLNVDIGQQVVQDREMMFKFPVALQAEVMDEVRKPFLKGMPIIRDLEMVSQKQVKQLCSEATSSLIVMHGDLVFAAGDTGTHWRIVSSGHLLYICTQGMSDMKKKRKSRRHTDSLDSDGEILKNVLQLQHRTQEKRGALAPMTEVGTYESMVGLAKSGMTKSVIKGRFVSEMVLWTPWVHPGDLIATSDSNMLQLSFEGFHQVLKARVDTCLLAACYAYNYVRQMSLLPGGVSDLFEFETIGDDSDAYTTAPHYTVFLSHYKAEAGTEATLMQEALQSMLSRDDLDNATVFLDSEDLSDLSTLRDHVINSRNLVLLLTPGVLLRPWCLVEIVTAFSHGVQVVPVEIQRPGMGFVYPDEQFYTRLLHGELINEQDSSLLQNEGIELTIIEDALRCVFTQIALPFSPHKSKGIREAELLDIVKRCSPGKSKRDSEQSIHSLRDYWEADGSHSTAGWTNQGTQMNSVDSEDY